MSPEENDTPAFRVEVGRSYREVWFITLVALSVCLVVAGVLLLAVHHRGGPTVLILAGVVGFSTAMSSRVIARTRFEVEDRPGGFVVRSRRGEHEFADEQVICASLGSRPNYRDGILRSTTRTFDLWIEDQAGPERITMINDLALGQSDPLAPLIRRLTSHLYDRAAAALEAGESFEGEGWTLHRSELVVHKARGSEAVRFDALVAADVFDKHLCVWKHGQDEPVLRIPAESANTPILLRILRERIAPAEEGESAPGGLGRVLFERKPGRIAFAVLWIFPVLGLGTLLLAVLASLKGRPELLFVGVAAAGVSGVFVALALSQCVEFRVHEHGVRRKLLFSVQQVRYTDVDAFTYSAVRQYVKGVYSGTNFTLTFASSAAGKLKKLTYSKKLRNADSELDHLRDSVSQLIADRMQAQFASGRTVVWTDGLRFLAEGLEYRASGFFGRKAPVMIPYSQIAGFELDAGVFWLWIAGKKSAAVKENVSQPNFFPGYFLLSRLLSSRPVATPAIEQAG